MDTKTMVMIAVAALGGYVLYKKFSMPTNQTTGFAVPGIGNNTPPVCSTLPAPSQGMEWQWNGFQCVQVPVGAIAL